jgi:hypothetical protein
MGDSVLKVVTFRKEKRWEIVISFIKCFTWNFWLSVTSSSKIDANRGYGKRSFRFHEVLENDLKISLKTPTFTT